MFFHFCFFKGKVNEWTLFYEIFFKNFLWVKKKLIFSTLYISNKSSVKIFQNLSINKLLKDTDLLFNNRMEKFKF